jgi:RHS repeat-associated protein
VDRGSRDRRLYYYRARYYDHRIGRSISEDLMSFSRRPSLYGYVANNPARSVDPLGLFTEDTWPPGRDLCKKYRINCPRPPPRPPCVPPPVPSPPAHDPSPCVMETAPPPPPPPPPTLGEPCRTKCINEEPPGEAVATSIIENCPPGGLPGINYETPHDEGSGAFPPEAPQVPVGPLPPAYCK